MKYSRRVWVVITIIVWLFVLMLFATHTNIKSHTTDGGAYFGQYNFEYKKGFPTPWHSKYYQIDEKEVSRYDSGFTGTCRLFNTSCRNGSAPPDSALIYTDTSLAVLGVQAGLALLTALTISGSAILIGKYAYTRH